MDTIVLLESVGEFLVEQSRLCFIILGCTLAYAGWRRLLRPGFLNEVTTGLISNVLSVCISPLLIYESGNSFYQNSSI